MILSIDTEKVGVPTTGLNTRAGDAMVIKFKYAQPVISGTDNTRVADRMDILLHAGHGLEVHDVGVRVYD